MITYKFRSTIISHHGITTEKKISKVLTDNNFVVHGNKWTGAKR